MQADTVWWVEFSRITAVQRDTSVWVGRAASAVIWSCCHLISHWPPLPARLSQLTASVRDEASALHRCSAARDLRGTIAMLACATCRGLRGYRMSVEMIAPEWMHSQITAAEYESWSKEQCAGIEIVDGMVVVSPSASKRHNRLARILANAFDAAAGPDWNADTDFDVRLQDVPLTNRRPDVVVYRADTIDERRPG